MKLYKISLIFFLIIFILGFTFKICYSQFPWSPFFNPCYPSWRSFAFNPLGVYCPIINPVYRVSPGFMNPLPPLLAPPTALLSPYNRSPNATIIFTSPTLTSVTTAPGIILIGSTTALGAPTVVAPTAAAVTTTVAPAAPAPLFSLLAVLYASALVAPALLSTANPLLFAYLSTLVL